MVNGEFFPCPILHQLLFFLFSKKHFGEKMRGVDDFIHAKRKVVFRNFGRLHPMVRAHEGTHFFEFVLAGFGAYLRPA